jgi:uncharacterized protein with HEPN domain
MSVRSGKQFLEDILEAIDIIEEYTSGLNGNSFAKSRMVVDAVIRNLEIIGEAAKNVPEEIQSSNPEISWQKMTALRNRIIHAYFGVDTEILWDIVSKNLPETKTKIKIVLQKLTGNS